MNIWMQQTIYLFIIIIRMMFIVYDQKFSFCAYRRLFDETY